MLDILRNLTTDTPTYNAPLQDTGWKLGDFFALAINVSIGVGFSIGILSVAYSGMLYVMSSGDPKETKKAWNAFLWGAIVTILTIGILVIKNAILIGLFRADSVYENDVPNLN